MSIPLTPSPHVLVVGAGPTGLMLACELTRQGVACRIVDQAPGPSRTSKALGLQARTLELFDRLGIADRAVAAGLKVHGARLHSAGRQIAQLELDQIASRFNYVLILPQSDTERLLTARLAELGLAVERQTEFVGLTQQADGVESMLRHTDSGIEERVRVPWLVGCDGAHSAVRHALAIAFLGKAFDESFALADLRLEADVPGDEISIYLSRGRIIALFPMSGDKRFRMILEDPALPATQVQPTLEPFQAALDDFGPPGARVSDAVWTSAFRISQRQVTHYRAGRVFLAGDAAHIHSPMGGQGMNTGIQDAVNLAWKLTLAVSGHARPSLLDSYEAERQPIGAALLRATGALTHLVLARNPVAGMLRDHLAPLVTSLDPVQERIRGALSELAVHYRHSPIVCDDAPSAFGGLLAGAFQQQGALCAGDRAPDGDLEREDGSRLRLFDLLAGTRHTLLFFATGTADPDRLAAITGVLETILRDYGEVVSPYVVAPPGSEQSSQPAGVSVLGDVAGELECRYAPAGAMLYLIRPDGYIGCRRAATDAARLREYLDRVFVGPAAS